MKNCSGATGSSKRFFEAEAPRLAEACHEMSRRFLAGGRLLAFGNGSAATDAQHVSVEFVHPVIVGKRALPALDLGPDFERRLPVLLRPEDMVMGFAFPEADESVERALQVGAGAGGADVQPDGRGGGVLVRAAGRGPVRRSGGLRGPLPRALGDGPRLLRAPRTGPRRGQLLVPLPLPRQRTAAARRGRGARCRARCSRRCRR